LGAALRFSSRRRNGAPGGRFCASSPAVRVVQPPDLRAQRHELALHDQRQARKRLGRFARQRLDLLSLEWCVEVQRTAYDRIDL
jgi:hypothetical protein